MTSESDIERAVLADGLQPEPEPPDNILDGALDALLEPTVYEVSEPVVLRLRPGDTLVLQVDKPLTLTSKGRIAASLTEQLECKGLTGVSFMILDGGQWQIRGVLRSDDQESD